MSPSHNSFRRKRHERPPSNPSTESAFRKSRSSPSLVKATARPNGKFIEERKMIVLQLGKLGNLGVKLETAVSYLDNKPKDNEEHLALTTWLMKIGPRKYRSFERICDDYTPFRKLN